MKYTESDLVRIAKRENNTRRNYLVVNPLQGKHIPVSPTVALDLFTSLADTFQNEYKEESLLLIGFAETATAIGAQVAITRETNYIQTTREKLPNVEYLFFSEEHSHATEQKLVKNDIDAIISKIDRILFIEDEVTTGKTILNIIDLLKKQYPKQLKFSVASLLNGMTADYFDIYKKKGIPLHYLIKTDPSTYSEQAERFVGNGEYCNSMDTRIAKKKNNITQLTIKNKMDTRRLSHAIDYKNACENLWNTIDQTIGNLTKKKLLVVGTEEFMYPALYIGKKLEERGNTVLCHSTTRSPIVVSLEKEYPLHTRYELKSLYNNKRTTFFYNVDSYDMVLIVTDAPENETEGLETLLHALGRYNENITLIRWC